MRRLARAGTEGRAGGEGAGAHAEARAERGRNVAEEITAAGAAAIGAERSGEIGAHPLTAGFARRIDTLHGEAGQELHFSPSVAAKLRLIQGRQKCVPPEKSLNSPWQPKLPLEKPQEGPSRTSLRASTTDGRDCGAGGLWCQEKRLQDMGVGLRESEKWDARRNFGKYEDFR